MSRKNEIVAVQVSERKALWAAVRRAEPIQQVRRLMREKKLLNKDLADRLGISEAGISRLLRGNQNIQIDTLFMLADALEEPLTLGFGSAEESITYEYDEDCLSIYENIGDIGVEYPNVVSLNGYRKYTAPNLRNVYGLPVECAA